MQGVNWNLGHLRAGSLGFGNPFLPQENSGRVKSGRMGGMGGWQGRALSDCLGALRAEAEQRVGGERPKATACGSLGTWHHGYTRVWPKAWPAPEPGPASASCSGRGGGLHPHQDARAGADGAVPAVGTAGQ